MQQPVRAADPERVSALVRRAVSGDTLAKGVRICAASWDPEAVAQAWPIRHLVQTYRPRELTARALVKAHRALAVIDGLDEMDREDHPGFKSRAGQACGGRKVAKLLVDTLENPGRGRGRARSCSRSSWSTGGTPR